jgi:hypothetical protein
MVGMAEATEHVETQERVEPQAVAKPASPADQGQDRATKDLPIQDLRALVQDMGQWRRAPIGNTQLIVISPGAALPQAKRTTELDAQIAAGIKQVSGKRSGSIYQTSPSDFAVLLRCDQHMLVSIVRDYKIQLLRAIETHSPKSFGSIDQSRLVISYELASNYKSAAERIAKYAVIEQSAVDKGAEETNQQATTTLRPFTEDDVRNVMAAYKDLGPEKFVKAFVRNQAVVVNARNRPLKHMMNEFFISMSLLRKPLFGDVEMRGSGRMFNDFTLVLDQIFLRAFKSVNVGEGMFSINLNVETVFTKAFENFLDEAPRELMSKVFFEFRQPNIVEHFDEFEVARGLIKGKGARIVVDRIFPDTLGLVDLDYLGASIAKVHWRDGADDALKSRGKAVKYITDCGVLPVLIRCDSPQALEVGAEMGVETFQGFLIDDMMRQRAA